MGEPVVRVRDLEKRYRVWAHAPPTNLKERLRIGAASLRARAHVGTRDQFRQDVWALRGISFDVGRGEVLGVIGHNGAGKSTLLAILSRITEPTAGRVEITGRVSSLLEVGTGFHPELTGRDNVFLNGAILGMSRAETRQKFDEIVEFSGVGDFIDIPVKRYSSGMQVRLAFSVAAHLDPEVLLLDEVLAVGDAAFQAKCHARVEEIAHSGRTVLFVSHDTSSVLRLCRKAIVLDSGQLVFEGRAEEAVEHYLVPESSTAASTTGRAEGPLAIRAVTVHAADSAAGSIRSGEPLRIEVELEAHEATSLAVFRVDLEILDAAGMHLVTLSTDSAAGDPANGRQPISGRMVLVCDVAGLPLRPGLYTLRAVLHGVGGILDRIERAAEIPLAGGSDVRSGSVAAGYRAPVLARHGWTLADPAAASIASVTTNVL